MMRIVVDMQAAQTRSQRRGVGRYCTEIVEALIRLSPNDEIYLVLNGMFPDSVDSIRSYFEPFLGKSRIRVWLSPWRSMEERKQKEWGIYVEEVIREQLIANLSPDVILLTGLLEDGINDNAVTTINKHRLDVPTVGLIYDLIPLIYHEEYLDPWPGYKSWYLAKIQEASKLSGVACISESSCNEVINYTEIPRRFVHNIGCGIAPTFSQVNVTDDIRRKVRHDIGLTKPFVMYAGGSDFRKNLRRLVKAYSHLPTTLLDTHQLLFVGDISPEHVADLRATARKMGLDDTQVLFSGYVAEETLVWLYNMAEVFVFPSVHEGFGLPVAEAMACGTPVIGADASSVRDIIIEKDALFDPYSEAEITSRLNKVLTDDQFRARLATWGLNRAASYAWKDCGNRLSELLHDVTHARVRQTRNSKCSRVHEGLQLRKSVSTTFDFAPSLEDVYRIAEAMDESLPRGREKHLFIDISDIVQSDARTGIQRVVRAVLRALLEQEDDRWIVRPVYAPPGEDGYRYADVYINDLLGLPWESESNDLIETEAGDVFLGLDWSPVGAKTHARAIRHMHRKGVQVLFVVYDLLPLVLPHRFNDHLANAYREWIEVVIQFDGAVCISRSVADELRSFLSARPDTRGSNFDVTWFPLGCDIKASVPSRGAIHNASAVMERIQSDVPAFLMVGTIEPRKCHEQVLDAFCRLWREGQDVTLVFVGKPGWVSKDFLRRLREANENEEHFYWLDAVSDEYLETLYQNVNCLIAASEGEGYGLPLVEGAHHGVPILARDIPVFREVLGGGAYFFEGSDSKALSKAIHDWIELWRHGEQPMPSKVTVIDWRTSAKALLKEIESMRREGISESEDHGPQVSEGMATNHNRFVTGS